MPGDSFHGIVAVFLDIDNLLMRTNWLVHGPGTTKCPYMSIYGDSSPGKKLGLKKSPPHWLGQDPELIKAYCNRIIAINRAKGLKTFFACVTSKADYDDLVDIVAVELAAFLGKLHDKEVSREEQRAATEAFQIERVGGYQTFCEATDPAPYFADIIKHPLGGFFPGSFSHASSVERLREITVPKVCIMQGVLRYKEEGAEKPVDFNLNTWTTWARAYRKTLRGELSADQKRDEIRAHLVKLGLTEKALQNYVVSAAMLDEGVILPCPQWLSAREAVLLEKYHVIHSVVAELDKRHELSVVQSYLLDDGKTNCDLASANGVVALRMPEAAFYHQAGAEKPDGTAYDTSHEPTAKQQKLQIEKFWAQVLEKMRCYRTVATCQGAFLFQARRAALDYKQLHESRPASKGWNLFATVKNPTRAEQAGFLFAVMDSDHNDRFTFDARLALCYAIKAAISSEAKWFQWSVLLKAVNTLLTEVEKERTALSLAGLNKRESAEAALGACEALDDVTVPESVSTSASRL